MKNQQLKSKTIQSTLAIGLLILLNACSSPEQPVNTTNVKQVEETAVELTAEQFKTVAIRLATIEKKSLSGTIKVNGLLDVPPQNLVTISSPFGGSIKNTNMLQGMKIKKGQVVATIQNPDFIEVQQNYLDFKSQLEFLKLEFERQTELSDANVNSKKTVQKSKSEYESMRARVNGLKARLQLMNISIQQLENGNIQSTATIISPISGYVTQVNTNIGAVVSPTDMLFKIADTEHLHTELTVFEKDVPQIKIGQKVRFVLSNEDKERTATVYLIGREISSERTVNVHCHLDKEDGELLPGMYLKALVERGSQLVMAVPNSAIVDFEGQKYIFVSANTHVKNTYHFNRIPIKIGVSELGFTEVLLPLNIDVNSKIVVNGAYDLLSKMKNSDEEGY